MQLPHENMQSQLFGCGLGRSLVGIPSSLKVFLYLCAMYPAMYNSALLSIISAARTCSKFSSSSISWGLSS